MADGEDQDLDLELTDQALEPDEANDNALEGDHATGDDGDAGGETVIAFADETEGEPEDTPLVKRLRDQLRDAQRQIAKNRRAPAANDSDPEPTIPPRKSAEDFDWDTDRADAYADEREAAILAHAEWKARAKERETAGNRAAEEQARQLEQQRKTLGVGDYEERSATVKDRLTDAQLGILINGAQNPARLIYALGRSPAKLDQLAGEDNLARFAVMLGSLEKDIKVIKRNAPAADTAVRGSTASAALPASDKELERLEKEADRTNDRSKVIAYRRKLKAAKAA